MHIASTHFAAVAVYMRVVRLQEPYSCSCKNSIVGISSNFISAVLTQSILILMLVRILASKYMRRT